MLKIQDSRAGAVRTALVTRNRKLSPNQSKQEGNFGSPRTQGHYGLGLRRSPSLRSVSSAHDLRASSASPMLVWDERVPC